MSLSQRYLKGEGKIDTCVPVCEDDAAPSADTVCNTCVATFGPEGGQCDGKTPQEQNCCLPGARCTAQFRATTESKYCKQYQALTFDHFVSLDEPPFTVSYACAGPESHCAGTGPNPYFEDPFG